MWGTVERHKDKGCIQQVMARLGMEVLREGGLGDTFRTCAGLEGGSWEGVPGIPRFLVCTAGPVVEISTETGMLVEEGWAWGKRRGEVFVGYRGGGETTGRSGPSRSQSAD